MATWALPTIAAATEPYEFQTQLEGQVYTFGLRWNARAGRHFYDIKDADGVPLVLGQPVVLRIQLLRWKDKRLPPGSLRAVAMSGDPHRPPGQDELGTRVRLIYTDSTGA